MMFKVVSGIEIGINGRKGYFVSDGGKVRVWRNLRMRRIPDFITKCVCYVFPDEESAHECKRIGGTGFFLSVPAYSTEFNACHTYVVTNRHVAFKSEYKDGEDPQNRFIRIKRLSGTPDVLEIEKWVGDETGNDLAIARIDMSGSNLAVDYVPIPSGIILSRTACQENMIGVGDDTISMGRFAPADAKDRHTPVVRFGRISSDPVQILQPKPRSMQQESFLIECFSYMGYSGAPVLVTIDERVNVWPLDKPNELSDYGHKLPIWLLGVNWGHTSDVTDLKKERRKINTGLMCAVPGWYLSELLDVEELVSARKKDEAKSISEDCDCGSVMD